MQFAHALSYLSERFLRPRLFAKVFTINLLVGHVYTIRQCGHQREYPYGGDYLCRGPYGHPRLERVDDDEKPVDGDGRQCQRRRVDAGALGVWYDVTEYLTEHPMACGKQKVKNTLMSVQNGQTLMRTRNTRVGRYEVSAAVANRDRRDGGGGDGA